MPDKKIRNKKQLKAFAQENSLVLPRSDQPKSRASYIVEMDMLRFVKENNCIITPVGWRYYIENYLKSGRCPCDPERVVCPCNKAKTELREIGHCLCTLFWRSYDAYIAKRFTEEPIEKEDQE
jgi:hypothetical protein